MYANHIAHLGCSLAFITAEQHADWHWLLFQWRRQQENQVLRWKRHSISIRKSSKDSDEKTTLLNLLATFVSHAEYLYVPPLRKDDVARKTSLNNSCLCGFAYKKLYATKAEAFLCTTRHYCPQKCIHSNSNLRVNVFYFIFYVEDFALCIDFGFNVISNSL